MKILATSLAAISVLSFRLPAQAANEPVAPTLQEVFKRPNPHVVIFRPTHLANGHTLNVTHLRMGDGSVKPGAGVHFVVYASKPNLDGEHEVLFQDFHFLTREGSPVKEFSYTSDGGRNDNGIIAILIGLSQPTPNSPIRPGALPAQDVVSAEITDGTSIALLVPAVQKVRSAAAR